jgi:hypothetical protein
MKNINSSFYISILQYIKFSVWQFILINLRYSSKSIALTRNILLCRLLSNNRIKVLPAGVFDKLENLETLWVYLIELIELYIANHLDEMSRSQKKGH